MQKLGTETGSMMNHLYSRETSVTPKVGMGCTILMWTDRHAATIVKVTPKTVTVQQDRATRIDKEGMSEAQEYEYAADPSAPLEVYRLTKRGWRRKGRGLLIGERREYYDYSF